MTETTPKWDRKAWRDSRIVTYTDGSLVKQGDRIRYHQAPGGILAHGKWQYGTAEHLEHAGDVELFLCSGGRYYNLYSHVVERVDSV